MLSDNVTRLDASGRTEDDLAGAVGELSLAEIEELSIADISRLSSNVLKDVLNDALRSRLERHRGGTYTSPAAQSLSEADDRETARA